MSWYVVTSSIAAPIYSDRGATLLIGDSMMRVGLGPVLRRQLAATFGPSVDLKAKGSTGLARPDFYDWPKAISEITAKRDYRTVIVLLGTNDCQNISEDKTVYRFGTPEWTEIYAKRLSKTAELLCEQDRKVYWLTIPPMQSKSFDQRIKKLNKIIKSTLARQSCVEIFPIQNLISNNGNFSLFMRHGKRRLRVRQDDGVHFTTKAGELISQRIIETLR